MATEQQLAHHFPDYKISGDEFIVKDCPMGNHKPWKLSINLSKNVGKCFICHATGEGVSLSKLVNDPSIKVKDREEKEKPITPIPESTPLKDLDFMHPAFMYLTSRGVLPELGSEMDFRWKEKGVPAWEKETDLGFNKRIARNVTGLVIPLKLKGRSKGWQFTPVPRVDRLPKYMTAPGSKLKRFLYNFDKAKNSDILLVVEGVFDTLKLPECSVALFGDGISDGKRRLISTGGFEEVVLCLDGDRPKSHIERERGKLLNTAPVVRSVKLPDGKDPGDFTADELRHLCNL